MPLSVSKILHCPLPCFFSLLQANNNITFNHIPVKKSENKLKWIKLKILSTQFTVNCQKVQPNLSEGKVYTYSKDNIHKTMRQVHLQLSCWQNLFGLKVQKSSLYCDSLG